MLKVFFLGEKRKFFEIFVIFKFIVKLKILMNIFGFQQKKIIGVSLKLVSVYFYENVFFGSLVDSYNNGYLYEKQY